MQKFILPLFAFLLLSNLGYSQKKIKGKELTVIGTILDKETKQPLEYATVSFFSKAENKIVEGGITNEKGEFSIPISQGVYDISLEYMSYKTVKLSDKEISSDLNLGSISLEINLEALDAVEVIAETTTVDIKLDKKIYNIGKDLTAAGGTISDALNNVPSVSVDVEGAISLRGNENVRILINGKPSAMAGFGDTNVLSQLPAEAIERVEVITSPSARYDAEGTAGILNIILRQKETLGFNGSVNLTAGHPDNLGASTNLNYRTEKFNLFSNLGYRYYDAPRNGNSYTTYFDKMEDGQTVPPEFENINENQEITRLNRNFNASLGMEYFLTKKTALTGSIFYRYGEDADESLNLSKRYNSNILEEQTLRREQDSEAGNSFQFALNYVTKFNDEGHELTADFQYENQDEDQFSDIDENYITTNQINPTPFQEEKINQNDKEKEYLIQADYVLPIGEDTRFEAGFRGNFKNEITDYILRQEDLSTGDFFVNDTISNIFDYTENIAAVYTQYGTKFGDFSFLLGLRLENTQLKGHIDSRLTDQELEDSFGFPVDVDFNNNYLGLFPTVNIIYNLANEDEDGEESITLGYNRRINRPRGYYINPFPTRSSRTNVFQGNPNLAPAFASAFDIGYLKRWDKLTLTTSIYYQHETGSFERVEEETGHQTSDGIDIIRTVPINLSSNDRTGGEIGILYNPYKWLRLNSSFNYFHFKKEGVFNDVDYGNKDNSWFARFSSKVTLPGKIDWQTNMNYRGPNSNAQSTSEGIFSMDLAFSKEINDNATISLNVRDVFNSRKRRTLTETDFFERDSEFQWRPRQINVSFLYRFNQQKQRHEKRGDRGDQFDDSDFEG
ncbi:outer membrane beta-barrel protein [Pseudotamlana agarivorans]|uniref:outer membrane beta-barrel protein n=1 Tax=Pseudotamlana agarivorans TaxID=481183 RepID=UPI00082E9C6B|nr:outer membrane beta-barrel protein [Tamlana agarivorans]